MHLIDRVTTAHPKRAASPAASLVAQTDAGPVVIFLDATGALLEDLDDWTPDLVRRVAAIGQGPFAQGGAGGVERGSREAGFTREMLSKSGSFRAAACSSGSARLLPVRAGGSFMSRRGGEVYGALQFWNRAE